MGREQRRDHVYAGRAGTPKRTCCVADALADLELVIAHTTLLFAAHRAPPSRFWAAQDLSTHAPLRLLRLLNSPGDSTSAVSRSCEARPRGSIGEPTSTCAARIAASRNPHYSPEPLCAHYPPIPRPDRGSPAPQPGT